MRGGKREKAGRKSTWVSGCKFEDTKLIRVPAAIAVQLLDLAHKLDAGDILDSETKPKTQNSKPDVSLEPFSIACPKCLSTNFRKDGLRNGEQRYECKECKKKFLEHTAAKHLDSVTNC